jgi:hypothetical protein
VSSIFISVIRGIAEIDEYHFVVHYSEVIRLDVLVDKAVSVQFFNGLNHLDKYLMETQLVGDFFAVEVTLNGVLSIFLNDDLRAI